MNYEYTHNPQTSPSTPSDTKIYRDRLSRHRTAMLVTQAGDGVEGARARPMAIARIDADGTTYFLSPGDTGKVDELLQTRSATITAQASTAYASVRGIARVENDPELLDALWGRGADLWYGDKKEVVVIAFEPREAEFWSADLAGMKLVFESIRAAVKGETVDPDRVGSHEHLEFNHETDSESKSAHVSAARDDRS